MYGWRANIGLITPMSENIEHAFHIHAPEGVSFASTKVSFALAEGEDREVLIRRAAEAASLYRDYGTELVVFGCSTRLFPADLAWEQACVSRMEEACGHPVLSAGTAALDALKALGAKKVAVMTPYDRGGERELLESSGIEVTSLAVMDVSATVDRGYRLESCDEYMLYRNALKVNTEGADAFFLSGMELSAMELIGDLETVLGIPVVTGQQAALWSALRRCRVGAKPERLGRLFQL